MLKMVDWNEKARVPFDGTVRTERWEKRGANDQG